MPLTTSPAMVSQPRLWPIAVVNAAAAAGPVTEALMGDGVRRAGSAREIMATLARAAGHMA